MLALALGKTVGELKACMTEVEFAAWMEFYELYPFDDRHRYHRPVALLAHYMRDVDPSEAMNWLQPLPSAPGEYTQADLNTLKAFGFKPRKKVAKE